MRTIGLEEHAWTSELRDALLEDSGDETIRRLSGAGTLDERLRDVGEERLRDMEEQGIDFQVLSVPTPGTQPLRPAQAVALARDANGFLADAVSACPDRFAALATLPTPDPEAAAAELERSVTELGLIGAMVFPRTGDDVYLDHEMFRPIFESAAALGVPLYIHPQLPPRRVRDACYSGFSETLNLTLAGGGWGWHADAGLAALRLILAGTFDRHPDLQLILGHWGEMLVSFLERADVLSNRGASHLQRRVADYITGNVLVTAGGIYSHRMLGATIAAVGADRVLFASDYPYHRPPAGAARAFIDTAPISPDDAAKLAHRNAERLLGASAGR